MLKPQPSRSSQRCSHLLPENMDYDLPVDAISASLVCTKWQAVAEYFFKTLVRCFYTIDKLNKILQLFKESRQLGFNYSNRIREAPSTTQIFAAPPISGFAL